MDASMRLDDTATTTADDTIATYAYARVADEITSASATSRDPLPIVLKAALTHIERGERDLNAADGHYTSAALRFKELKERVKAGEAGKVAWADYCAKHIPSLTQRAVDSYIAMVKLGRSWGFKEHAANMVFGAGCSAKVWQSPMEDALYGMHKARREAGEKRPFEADAQPTSSASEGSKPKRDPEARKAQNARAQANRRAKSSTIREANGGKASKPRQDRETAEQYSRLAMMAKVLDAGQLQIINEIIEERWPGTEEKAKEARAERDAA
jgi:hypothetical protein